MKILFICLGNICRSPTAEAVFRKKFKQHQISAYVDSAATSNYHIGDPSDPRSIAHAHQRGYEMTHLGRQVQPHDFAEFDYILAMDSSNIENLMRVCPENFRHKVELLTDYANNSNYTHVPDPYHGTDEDFENVLDIIEDCASGFIEYLNKKKD